MPTDQLRHYCTFLDPEALSFAPGQVIIVLQTLTDEETEANCEPVLAVWHNKTWFNPRSTNVFVLKSANAAARALGLQTCICWRPKYSEVSGSCLTFDRTGEGDFIYVPQTAPRAFLVTLQGVSISDVEEEDDDEPGYAINRDDNCWERLPYRPENYASEVRFISSFDSTNTEGTARFWSSVPLSGDTGYSGNKIFVDHFPCAYGFSWIANINNATLLSGSAYFDLCILNSGLPEDGIYRVGSLRVSLFAFPFSKDDEGEYHGMGPETEHRIVIPLWTEGDEPVDLWKPRVWPVEHQTTMFTGGGPVGLHYNLHVDSVRVEPVA